MNSRVKRLSDELDVLWKLKRDNDSKIDAFLEDPRIREFLNLYQSNEEIRKAIEVKTKQYVVSKMETCDHAFVVTEVVPFENGKTSKVYRCVKCGLTNEYEVKDMSDLVDYPKSVMEEIYKDTFLNSVLIYDEVIDIPFEEIAKIYEVVTSEHPYIGLYELRERIKKEVALIKGMLLKK